MKCQIHLLFTFVLIHSSHSSPTTDIIQESGLQPANLTHLGIVFFIFFSFPCPQWHFYYQAISDIKSPDIKLTSKRWGFRHRREAWLVLFGFPEWSSKWFKVT